MLVFTAERLQCRVFDYTDHSCVEHIYGTSRVH